MSGEGRRPLVSESTIQAVRRLEQWPVVDDAAEWLARTSRSYHQDARRLERLEGSDGVTLEAGGMDATQWAIVYRAVAEELRKCADRIAS